MQLKINKFLNTLNLIIALVGVGIVVFINWINPIDDSQLKQVIYIALAVFSFTYFFVFKYLENRWDKKLILKMIEAEHVALAKILSADAVLQIRDSGFRNYIIYKINMEVTKSDLTKETIVCYEKFNKDVLEIPQGFVYITYDPNRPDYVFIIQNDLLAHFPELQPLVQNYERKVSDLKYLVVYQNDGLIIKTFKQHLNEQSKP